MKRHCLFAQSNDHPRVNPSFYSKPTRYVYVNMCMTEDADVSNLPQVSSAIPQPAGRLSALPGLSGVSWMTESAGSSDSLLPPAATLPMSLPLSLHAYAIRDTTPYTEVPLPVGGAPAEPVNILKQSFNTAKERLSSSFGSSYGQATGDDFTSIDSSMEEEAFPVSANKLTGKTAGSTRDGCSHHG